MGAEKVMEGAPAGLHLKRCFCGSIWALARNNLPMLHIETLNLDLASPPDDVLHFCRDLEIIIEGNEDFRCYAATFWIEVCTPSWLAEKARNAGWTWGRRRLVIPRWDAQTVERAVTSVISEASRTSWTALVHDLELYWHSEDLPDSSDASGPL